MKLFPAFCKSLAKYNRLCYTAFKSINSFEAVWKSRF